MNKILFIEDEPVERFAGTKILDELSLIYDVAETGRQALVLLQQKIYNLILCDLGLPDITGFEIARKIKNEPGLNQTTPLFALTIHHDKEYQKRATDAGMAGLIAKPLTKERCKNILESIQNSKSS